jgi:predicted GNAT family N-acyltransferase
VSSLTATIEPLGPRHDRAAFSCGKESLDDFIKTKARKESELGYCAVFVMVERANSSRIVGYYSLSSHSVTLEGIGPEFRKKLPKYPIVPTTLIGRLARDLAFRGLGVGEFLLMDALKRATHSSRQVGSYAVTVDAIDAEAAAFYDGYGFTPLAGHDNRLYLPMASIRRLDF